jgi:hypothetical protein
MRWRRKMKKSTSRIFTRVAMVTFAALGLANCGCLLVAAGAAGGAAVGYAYYKGKISEVYSAGLDDSWAATRTALAELGMPILKEDRGAAAGTIETRTAEDDQVRISLEALRSSIPAEPQLTKISVRVATFGDRPVSDRILYQIGLHLAPAGYVPLAPVAQAPSTPGVVQTGGSAGPPMAVPQQTAPPPLLPPQPEPVQK